MHSPALRLRQSSAPTLRVTQDVSHDLLDAGSACSGSCQLRGGGPGLLRGRQEHAPHLLPVVERRLPALEAIIPRGQACAAKTPEGRQHSAHGCFHGDEEQAILPAQGDRPRWAPCTLELHIGGEAGDASRVHTEVLASTGIALQAGHTREPSLRVLPTRRGRRLGSVGELLYCLHRYQEHQVAGLQRPRAFCQLHGARSGRSCEHHLVSLPVVHVNGGHAAERVGI
mmetsp:Transcript_22816/g.50002  ORF Transcript_22816/g.50002 Transcript_22816/m.50002 type:complete len:227 (-) Transcript_22816:342-1022(-)